MKKFCIFITSLMSVGLLTSCGSSPTQHIVTFESNGGTHIDTQKVNDKETAIEPNPAPTKTDYTFGGWFINPEFSGEKYNFSTPITNDITLYANWNGGPQPTYTVEFQGENCSSTLTPTTQYHTGDKVNFNINVSDNTKYKLPEKINIAGVSSYDYYNLEGKVSFTIESNNVLVAINAEEIKPSVTHTVTFVLNGATSSPIEPVIVNEGNPYPSDKIPVNPTKPGHIFEGWSSNEKTKTIVDLSKAPIVNYDLILYAWWSEAQSVDITFDANGGYFDNDETVTSKTVPTTYGQIPVAPTPKKVVTGQTSIFKGWNKTLEIATAETTYTAQWDDVVNKCHVTFDANGGTITSGGEPRDVDYGGKINTAPTVVKDGYGEPTGWYDAATGGNQFIFGTTKITSNLTLYAHWGDIKTYTVIFDADGGIYSETNTSIVTRENVEYNTMPTIPSNPIKIDSTGIKAYIFKGYDKNVVPVAGDATTITYKAQWKETTNVYTLIVTATDEGKFPDSTTTKNITLAAGSNVLNSIVNLAKPIYRDPDSLKIFDKYVYENGTEIDPLDIVNKDNIKVKASYRTLTKKTLEECSWDEIATISYQGKDFAEAYFGSITSSNPFTKNIIINGQVHKVRIIGYGQDIDNEGNPIDITFEFVNLISDANGYSLATYWENTNVTDGSNSDYLNSSIRKALTGEGNGELNWFQKDSQEFSTTYANKTVLDMLPTDLSSVLKTVKKTVNIKTNNTWTPTEFADKLFLLNPIELGSQREECEKSEIYRFYESPTSDIKEIRIRQQVKGADGARNRPIVSSNLAGKYTDTKRSYAGYHDGAGGQYWLRSPYTDKTNHGWMVYEGGSVDGLTFVGDYYVHCIARPVCPAFCI